MTSDFVLANNGCCAFYIRMGNGLSIKDVEGITDMIVFNKHPSWLCVFVREKKDTKAVRLSDLQTVDHHPFKKKPAQSHEATKRLQ
jgi:hypothetical protein